MSVRPSFFRLMILCCTALAAAPAQAQNIEFPLPLPVPLPDVTGFDSTIPKPEEVIGHQIGTRHTRPDQIVSYFEAVADASPRVTVSRHGYTFEHRPLIHAVVSSVANHARLEDIRLQNLLLSDDPSTVTDADIAGMPVVANFGYSVHGNEASGSEAALLTLYYLAAGLGESLETALENVVVIIDPALNPDGRDRFVDWVNRHRGRVATSDPQDREHTEVWPGGRTNHYWFDLNRDWLPAQLPESQARLELFHRWRPQLLTDHHEMGANQTFFFQPGVPSRNNPNTPERNFELTRAIAEFHAEALDEIGTLYYSEERFDDFYYGKGSTYPDVNGAIGILFEQASSRSLLEETDQGLMGYAYTVRNQFMTSLSTFRAIDSLRIALLTHQRDFYRDAPLVADRMGINGYVFGSSEYSTRSWRLAQLLKRHRIDVRRLSRSVSVDGQTFEPGATYVVPLRQAQAGLIKALMERVTSFTDSLFYDVSAWTMGLAFGVPHAELRQEVAGLMGDPIDDVAPRGEVMGESPTAYVMEWGSYLAPRALYRLLDAGLFPRVMTEPAEIAVAGGVRRFEAGTIVVPVEPRHPTPGPSAGELRRLLQEAANRDNVTFHAVRSGLTGRGPDLGAASSHVIPKPEVALLVAGETSTYQVGEAWYQLNEQMGIPVSLIDIPELGSRDLSRYNVIVMAGYDGGLSEEAGQQLEDWIGAGGTLIAIGSSVSWAADTDIYPSEIRSPAPLVDDRVRYGDVPELRGSRQLGGAIFEAELDLTHPVAYGHPARVPFFRNNRLFLLPLDRPGTTVARYTDQPLLSGYVSDESTELIRDTAPLLAYEFGDGRVILFSDDPNFRGFWYATSGLFSNAVFFGQVF